MPEKFNVQQAYANVGEDFVEEDMEVSVRQIKNGFILRRSWTERRPDGERDWKSEEEFYQENPIPANPIKPINNG